MSCQGPGRTAPKPATDPGRRPEPSAAPKTGSSGTSSRSSSSDSFEKGRGSGPFDPRRPVEIVKGDGDWATHGLVQDGRPLLVMARESLTVTPGPAPRATVGPHWPDKDHDGYFMGADGPYAPGSRLSEMRGVRPSDGRTPTHKIVYVNGVLTSRATHMGSLRAIADKSGAEVVGIYNATDGFLKDAAQTVGDKLNRGGNPAFTTLSRLLYAELSDAKGGSRPIHLMAHSQGAATVSRALEQTKGELRRSGLSLAQAEARLSRLQVDTFGGAGWTYTNGPRYHHYVNALDPVPTMLGPSARLHLGRDAKTTQFMSPRNPPLQHSFEDVYLRAWKPSRPEATN